MWIRSQNKTSLTKCKKLTIEDEWENGDGEVFKNALVENDDEVEYLLGTYESESRAIEVLDEIQAQIVNIAYSSYTESFTSPVYEMPEK